MSDEKSEGTIRQIIEARAKAVRDGDIGAMMAAVADDVLTYDVVEPLRREGKAATCEHAVEWVASYNGPLGWASRDTHVSVSGDVAFSNSLSGVTGKLKTGTDVDMWFRTTLGFRRTGGRWLIVHDHASAPFNPQSGQGSLGLKP